MDLIGKLKTTKSGYQYICVMVDYQTKWPQAYPLRTKTAAEVAGCIIKFFHQFEAPKRILTDQGSEFVNAVLLKCCLNVFVGFDLCSSYKKLVRFHLHLKNLVTLYFTVSLLHRFHVLTIVITIHYA